MNFLFYFVIFAGFSIELLLWKKITPCIISFVGIFVISIFYDLFGNALGFIDVDPRVYQYLISFYLCGFFASILVAYIQFKIYPYTTCESLKLSFSSQANKNAKWFIQFHLILCFFCLFSVVRASTIAGRYYGEAYEYILGHGVVGHAYVLLMASFPFLYLILLLMNKTTKVNRFVSFIIAFSIFLFFMKLIKYWMIIPLIWLLLLRIYVGRRLAISSYIYRLIIVLLSTVSLFVLTYAFQIVSSTTNDVEVLPMLIDISNHFLGYLFSGLLVFSTLIKDGFFNEWLAHDPLIFFNGAVSLVNVLISGEIYSGSEIIVPFYIINESAGKTGNVGTLWAFMLMYLGSWSFFIYFLIIAFMSILLCFSTGSIVVMSIYTCLASYLFLSWFASYFSLISLYEVPILSLLIYFIFFMSKKRLY